MSDIVNDYLKKFYPAEEDRQQEHFRYSSMLGGMLEYADRTVSTIFPAIVCNDGFRLSVQGHFGAYSSPRDDFADEYSACEIMCAQELLFEEARNGEQCGEEFIYPYIPIKTIVSVIEKHGGMKP